MAQIKDQNLSNPICLPPFLAARHTGACDSGLLPPERLYPTRAQLCTELELAFAEPSGVQSQLPAVYHSGEKRASGT